MKINHIAIWTNDPERLRDFYCTHFKAFSNDRYYNPLKQFTSYILTFETGSCSIEMMNQPDLYNTDPSSHKKHVGLAHIAFSVGSKVEVDLMTARLRKEGIIVYSEPRFTGDGFYESAIKDPDGNIVEITI